MQRVSGVCLDLFNTLVSVAEVPESVGRFTADILGVTREEWRQACFGEAHEICKQTAGLDILRTLAHSIDPTIPEDLILLAERERQARFDYCLVHVEPDVVEGLQRLKERGYRLALVSNASTSEVRAWSNSPLKTIFDSTHFSCEVGSKKPEPEIYLAALRSLGVMATQVCFVGDGGSNEHRGAHAIGMHTLLMTRFLTVSQCERMLFDHAPYLHGAVDNLLGLVEWLERGS